MKIAPIARNHVVVRQRTAGKHSTVIPVLYLGTSAGYHVMWALVDYFVRYSANSDAWKRNVARAVGLFYDYDKARNRKVHSSKILLREFVQDFCFGTIDPESHLDTTGLYWAPSGLRVAKRISAALENFIIWLEFEKDQHSGLLDYISKCREGEKITLRELHAGYSIAKFSMLEHLKDPRNIARRLLSKKTRFGYQFGDDPSSSLIAGNDYKCFPTELISPILEHGFIKNEYASNIFEREDITAKMIFLLLVHTGLRKGEPLHLWVSDVIIPFDSHCRVTLRHPSFAPTKIAGEQYDRRTYLLQRKLRPRNDNYNNKNYKVGWKQLDVDRKEFSAEAFWLHESSQAIFAKLYSIYLNYYRAPLLERYKKNHGTDHPFLFVAAGINRTTGESFEGAPLSLAALEKAYDKALDRTQKKLNIKIPRGRSSNMNLHCLRHHYAKAMMMSGVTDKVIQKCLHHRTINSQQAYKTLSSEKIRAMLSEFTITATLPENINI
ncbi:site-specific integrase [Pelagibaculum spongiae]|uniref:Tyr recombinase domain-containing protein n=1 Tax=Pelagibaculum spongiae TaxID=2080658 RepID=A0A2V1GT50_9GAMM|nr:site-specific integrase [Pelagibaculum spongiae]PVZ66787.1 hypothetical protein DC094_16125 [Pelagibaculum spongiae]